MAFGVIFRSNLAFAVRAHKQIGKSALFAAGEEVRKRAIKNAKKGMLTGDWVGLSNPPLYQSIFKHYDPGGSSSTLAGRISTGSLSSGDDAAMHIGTPVKHGAYWEEGHINIFVGRALGAPEGVYVRVPWLTNAFRKTITEQQKAATKAADATARRFGQMGLERLVGLTPIGSMRSTIGS